MEHANVEQTTAQPPEQKQIERPLLTRHQVKARNTRRCTTLLGHRKERIAVDEKIQGEGATSRSHTPETRRSSPASEKARLAGEKRRMINQERV
ncbi:hypothetical protein F2Q70_00008963 [Brassica cretica]|uniref:Uncharacterized protein n=1 Tax=Brassica cretica TaxID=69181 RepID=A0A8S9LV48_BRACR|nr:hypothetical protein F2Q70_00008963 [Brassica cretica]